MSGIRKEIWTGRLNDLLTQADNESFLADVSDESRYADNDVIHINDLGADPEVLVNNTTYPIAAVSQTDSDIAISLDKFDSVNTKVSDDELTAISYNKIDTVIAKHQRAIQSKKLAKYAHAIGAATNSTDTPIIKTSGSVTGGVKSLTIADILALKQSFDNLQIPEDQRVLVLSPEHINQLLAIDQKFAGQYYDAVRGKVMPLFYGFKITSYVSTPYYHIDGATGKLSFGAVPTANHKRASLAYYTGGLFRCTGSTKMYYQSSETNPTNRETVIGFRTRGICLPIKQKNIGAIISVS